MRGSNFDNHFGLTLPNQFSQLENLRAHLLQNEEAASCCGTEVHQLFRSRMEGQSEKKETNAAAKLVSVGANLFQPWADAFSAEGLQRDFNLVDHGRSDLSRFHFGRTDFQNPPDLIIVFGC